MKVGPTRIGARLAIGFGIVLSMLAIVVIGGAVINEGNMRHLSEGLDRANAKQGLAVAMQRAMLEIAVATRNVGLQTDVPAMQREEAKVKDYRSKYAGAREKLAAIGISDAEKELLASIARIDKETEQPFAQAIGQALNFNPEGAAKIIAGKIDPASQKALAEIAKLVDLQDAAAREIVEATLASGRSWQMLFGAIGVAAFAIGVAWAWVLTRGITRPLGEAVAVAEALAAGDLTLRVEARSTDEAGQLLGAMGRTVQQLDAILFRVRTSSDAIASASQEIAAGNQDLSQRTEEQASSLEETAASMEELTSTVKQNADNARQANQLAASASQVAAKGGTVVGEVVTTMGAINASSKKIADIIGVIDGIAFQTNILALNAAVEAARAGEQGRGFAVVASEVRNLAQRSAGAAKEIKTLIEDSVGKVDAGQKLVDRAGSTMAEVVASIRRVTDIMAEITAASEEQSAGIAQVNDAITQMDHVTQQNAALVEQAAAAAESMQAQAQQLTGAVAVFKLASSGARTVTPSQSAPVSAGPITPAASAAPERSAPARPNDVARLPLRPREALAPVKTGTDDWAEF